MLAFGGSGNKIPHMEIFNSGVSQMLAMAAAGEALRYVSYATQVLGKSCKMVPVMLGGLVLGGKSHKATEYAQVLLITIGVVAFNFGGKSKKGADDSSYGLLLISVSLLMDAVTGGLQDKVKVSTKKLNNNDKAKTSMFESMLWTNVSLPRRHRPGPHRPRHRRPRVLQQVSGGDDGDRNLFARQRSSLRCSSTTR